MCLTKATRHIAAMNGFDIQSCQEEASQERYNDAKQSLNPSPGEVGMSLKPGVVPAIDDWRSVYGTAGGISEYCQHGSSGLYDTQHCSIFWPSAERRKEY